MDEYCLLDKDAHMSLTYELDTGLNELFLVNGRRSFCTLKDSIMLLLNLFLVQRRENF